MLTALLSKHSNPLSDKQLTELAKLTKDYSSSDLTALAKDAALGPIRGNSIILFLVISHIIILLTNPIDQYLIFFYKIELGADKIKLVEKGKIRAITMHDFVASLKRIRHSVSSLSLTQLEKWNREYGDVSL